MRAATPHGKKTPVSIALFRKLPRGQEPWEEIAPHAEDPPLSLQVPGCIDYTVPSTSSVYLQTFFLFFNKMTVATMEAMEIMIAKMMSSVAKTDDLRAIVTNVKKCEVKIDEVASRVDHGNELASLRDEVERLKNGAGGTGSASPLAGQLPRDRQDDEWHPRIIMVRGWAPYGSDQGAKIGRHEALHLQELILNRLTPEMKFRCKFLIPFLQSHALSLEVLGGAGCPRTRSTYEDTKFESPQKHLHHGDPC